MNESTTGSWKYLTEEPGQSGGAPVLNSEQEAVHMSIAYIPDTGDGDYWKILYFMAVDLEGSPSKIKTRVFDLQAYEAEEEIDYIDSQDIPAWPGSGQPYPRIFCCGHAFNNEGEFFCAGGMGEVGGVPTNGDGLKFTYIFNPANEEWRVSETESGIPQPTPMFNPRWYPTVTRLGDNNEGYTFLVLTGTYKNPEGAGFLYNKDVEAFKPSEGWVRLRYPNEDLVEIPEEFYQNAANPVTYPGAHLIPYNGAGESNVKAGEIFYAFPLRKPWRLNIDGLGEPNPFFNQIDSEYEPENFYREHGASVMLPLNPDADNAEVLLLGGGPANGQMPTEIVQSMDLKAESLEWINRGSMAIPRMHVNAVLMPDGKIFICGGAQKDVKTNGITLPEIYDPNADNGNGISTLIPVASTFGKMYHSTAILLPDARILCSAGEYPYNEGFQNKNFEIYSPSYLFQDTTRPEILNISTQEVEYGNTFNITTNIEIGKAILMSLCAPTHGFDQNQRAVYLEVQEGEGDNNYILTAPANANIAPSGWYMLFVIKPYAESAHKIPSVAKFVKIIPNS